MRHYRHSVSGGVIEVGNVHALRSGTVVALTVHMGCRHTAGMRAVPPSVAEIWRAASNADRDTGPARACLASWGAWPP